MASEPIEPVDIFDDFDDAETMANTFCKQVSEDQYQEDTRSETDKALGELCLYLDQNPDVYSRVLRKRKQEEMEGAGVISYVKSKMMSLLHGERYPHCLVTASDCVQNTNALKAGMCKTFQLSQELKENVTRQSSRLAAKRQAKISTNKSLCVSNGRKAEDRSSYKSGNIDGPESSVMRDTTNLPQLDHPSKHPLIHLNLGRDNQSEPIVMTIPVDKDNCQKVINEINSQQNDRSQSLKTDLEKVNGELTGEIMPSQPALLEVSQSITVPVPPPAPPLPASFSRSSLPKSEAHQTRGAQVKLTSVQNNISIKPHTPKNLKLPFRQEQRSSPRTKALKGPADKLPVRTSSLMDLPSQFQSDSSTESSPFLTPDLPTRYRTHKRSQSNSSVSSISSSGSFSSVHSEILSTNPIRRLKATQVIRSPGGTPARQNSSSMVFEPFHKAFYTALKSRFRNVNTPSPRSGNSTINTSNKSVLNNTFSP